MRLSEKISLSSRDRPQRHMTWMPQRHMTWMENSFSFSASYRIKTHSFLDVKVKKQDGAGKPAPPVVTPGGRTRASEYGKECVWYRDQDSLFLPFFFQIRL